jgi:hypothetical protein
MNRPFVTPEEFRENSEFVDNVLNKLELEYNKFARKKNGIFSNHDLEKVFEKTLKIISPKNSFEKNIVEAIFDSFLGSLSMTGNSEEAFAMLRLTLGFDGNTYFVF